MILLCVRAARKDEPGNENRKRLLKEETCRRRIQSICRMSGTMYSKTVIFGKQNILQVSTYAKEARLKLIRNCRSYKLVTSSNPRYTFCSISKASLSAVYPNRSLLPWTTFHFSLNPLSSSPLTCLCLVGFCANLTACRSAYYQHPEKRQVMRCC